MQKNLRRNGGNSQRKIFKINFGGNFKIISSKNLQEVVSSATDKFDDKIAEKVVDKASQQIKQTAVNVKNKIGEKISETVENINAEISAMEAERKRKNFETMNQIRFNSNHLSDAQLRTLINDNSLDKFKRIGYAAAFADRYSDRRD